MTIVLDIDIDLFVDPRTSGKSGRKGGRVLKVASWAPESVCDWIGRSLGLACGEKIPGRVLETHEQLLSELADMDQPVHLYHLDAHSDLGFGQDCFEFHNEFLAIDKDQRRTRLKDFKPNEGNFLLFAIACGYISKIDYVTHPDLWLRNYDIPVGMDVWDDEQCSSGSIHLRRFLGTHEEYKNNQGKYQSDCSVPITVHHRDKFKAHQVQFDRLYITRSPRYTPEESDQVIEVLRGVFIED